MSERRLKVVPEAPESASEEGQPVRDIELSRRIYRQMRAIAIKQIGHKRNATLSPSALVNEAYLRLVQTPDLHVVDRNHFLSLAVRTMRWIIVDYARKKTSQRRGGKAPQVELTFNHGVEAPDSSDIVVIAEALERLENVDPRLCRIVELRFLMGLTVKETAEVLQISERTVKRDWELARAWLLRELRDEAA